MFKWLFRDFLKINTLLTKVNLSLMQLISYPKVYMLIWVYKVENKKRKDSKLSDEGYIDESDI